MAVGEALTAELLEAPLVVEGRIMPASNATFLARAGETQVVYKPVSGERPLWDFPTGTLAGREVAAYVVSEALGWDVVPLTFLRDGPRGEGMVQVWQEVDPDQDPVDLVPADEVPPGMLHVLDAVDRYDTPISLIHQDDASLRRMALFDVVVNNADRKGGHVLGMAGGHRYGVDHGITFHVSPKLRTVLWGWAGEPLDDEELAGLRALAADPALEERLAGLVSEEEVEAFRRRTDRLIARARFPLPSSQRPAIPWPAF